MDPDAQNWLQRKMTAAATAELENIWPQIIDDPTKGYVLTDQGAEVIWPAVCARTAVYGAWSTIAPFLADIRPGDEHVPPGNIVCDRRPWWQRLLRRNR